MGGAAEGQRQRQQQRQRRKELQASRLLSAGKYKGQWLSWDEAAPHAAGAPPPGQEDEGDCAATSALLLDGPPGLRKVAQQV